MRRLVFMLVLGASVIVPSDRGWGQSNATGGGIFWAPNTSRRITVSHDSLPVAVFTFPAGTFLDASYDDPTPAIAPGRWAFRGNLRSGLNLSSARPASHRAGHPPRP